MDRDGGTSDEFSGVLFDLFVLFADVGDSVREDGDLLITHELSKENEFRKRKRSDSWLWAERQEN